MFGKSLSIIFPKNFRIFPKLIDKSKEAVIRSKPIQFEAICRKKQKNRK